MKPIFGILAIIAFSTALAVAGNQGSVVFSGLPLFIICSSVGFILHWLAFIPAFAYQTEHYFDLIGSTSYIGTVILTVALHPGMDTRGLIISVMIAVWAVRLGSFLFSRVKKAGKDRRFNEIKTRFFRYMFTWTLGGAWVFITMAAGLAAMTSTTQQAVGIPFFIGTALWVLGFGLEVVADSQKTSFRRQPENAEKFITTGLWQYSRHPNYFGEIILWLGIAVMAAPVLVGWQLVTLVSPVFVFLLLTKVSGIPMLEKSGLERWGSDPKYQRYISITSPLVPLPRK
jgi:steroid 5-alpha reductase family enzyme|tara:strand:+ start:254 stop:1111 length:858 start_codon:yes stop_codon:yes gene_type:complete